MNHKKLLAAIVALTMSATTAVAFSGCKDNDKHTHEYTDWTVTTPATCTEPGVLTGTCEADNDTSTVPLPATGHKYGDWVIVAPTATAKGKATKTCVNDKNHVVEVELPVLGDEAYTVKTTKDTPTYSHATYTLSHAEGDIVFEANVSKNVTNTTLSVADAVATANDEIYSSLVGKYSGSKITSYYDDDEEDDVFNKRDFFVEYGDNYTHVEDGALQYWLEKDGDTVSGVVYNKNTGAYTFATEEDAALFEGIAFINNFAKETVRTPEEFLASLYASATETTDYDNEFTAKYDSEEGYYMFSWTVVSLVESNVSVEQGDGDAHIVHTDVIYNITVGFSLDENFMLSLFAVRNQAYTYAYDDGDELPYDYDSAKKTYSPKDTDKPYTEITQLEQSGLLPKNPMDLDDILINDFDVLASFSVDEDDKEVADAYEAEGWNSEIIVSRWGKSYELTKLVDPNGTLNLTTADPGRQLKIKFDEFAPKSAADFAALNPVNIYLVDGDDEELVGSSEKDIYNKPVYYDNSDQTLSLYGLTNAGDYVIKVTIGNATKTFTLHVTPGAPESIVTNVNVYNESKDDYDVKKSNSATVYVGQTLTFTVEGEAWDYEADSSATASLVEESGATLDGYSFVATEPGTYHINVVSTVNNRVTTTLTVTVESVPNVESMLDGEYEAGEYSVTFDGTTATVTGDGVNVEINWTYNEGKLSAESDGFSIELTENYKLVLIHGDSREVLKDPNGVNVEDLLAGTTWTYSGNSTSITFNADGTLTISNNQLPVYKTPATFNWSLTDNGDGTYSFTFEEVNDPSNGYYGIYLPDTEEGNYLEFDGSTITKLVINLDGAWAGTQEMTKSN